MINYRKIILLLFPILILLAACSITEPPIPVYPSPTPQSSPIEIAGTITVAASLYDGTFKGLTYGREDGNRVLGGKGGITTKEPLHINLGGEIRWLVGVPYQEGTLWTAVREDGILESFLVVDGQAKTQDLGHGPLPIGTPPMVLVDHGQVYLNTLPSPQASKLTHPASPQPDSGRVVFIAEDGDLVLWENGGIVNKLATNALPDARLIQDDMGRVLFLSGPTDRYDHGVLGDTLEADSITLVITDPVLEEVIVIEIPDSAVVEGIAPIWSDLNGDGKREILVTLSNYDDGSWLAIFSEDGEILAEGPRIGQGYRWRNQLAAAPLGAEGEILVMDILRPHLDGTLEFFRWEGDRLVLLAELPGFSTHQIGSRNLDRGLVGDLDGDGAQEVVVPNLNQGSLNGIVLVGDHLEVVWTIQLGGRLTSNLAGVSLKDGSLVFGVGVGNTLLVWE